MISLYENELINMAYLKIFRQHISKQKLFTTSASPHYFNQYNPLVEQIKQDYLKVLESENNLHIERSSIYELLQKSMKITKLNPISQRYLSYFIEQMQEPIPPFPYKSDSDPKFYKHNFKRFLLK